MMVYNPFLMQKQSQAMLLETVISSVVVLLVVVLFLFAFS